MKRNLILHVGMPKTGSTALQGFLKRHSVKFEDKKIGYYKPINQFTPWVTWSNASFLLTQLLLSLPEVDEGVKRAFLINNPSLDIVRLRFNEQTKLNLAKEIENFKAYVKKYDTVILSEEVIWHYEPFYESYWDTLKRIIDEYYEEPYEVKIIVYLRRQDQWFESKWKEDMRNQIPYTLDFEESLKAYDEVGYFDYAKAIQRVEKAFGKEAIIVRNYDRRILIKESIIEDFFDATKIENPIEVNSSAIRNPSLSAELARGMLLINKGDTKCEARENCPVVSNILSKYFKKNYNLMKTETAKTLLNKYEEGNTYINETYLTKETALSNIMKKRKVLKKNDLRDKTISMLIAFLCKPKICKKLLKMRDILEG